MQYCRGYAKDFGKKESSYYYIGRNSTVSPMAEAMR